MTLPRSALISLETTPYYHCISRCVRRAFLMGRDNNGNSFDHRKTWLVERIKFLGNTFAISIAAYAVMSNHYHLVLHADEALTQNWTDDEVQRRWRKLFRGPDMLQRRLNGESLSPQENQQLDQLTSTWRERLCSISWFMYCLNYEIALRANKEEGLTGRFWDGRFKSIALKDEAALLACMAYVDLNPIRAGLADKIADSDYTSIQERIRHAASGLSNSPADLMAFSDSVQRKNGRQVLPFQHHDYLELVDWHSRIKQPCKPGLADAKQPRLLAQLGLSDRQWSLLASEAQKEISSMLHSLKKIASHKRVPKPPTWLESVL
ncbi:MAG TPA: hypothetical protein VNR18_03440 [Hyphomicrobiales bacterium]|nr:hypothetical protein [Hyphomicrobiales bacterium]